MSAQKAQSATTATVVLFYNTAIQSLLCALVIVWIGLATKEDKNRASGPQKEKIGVNLPSIHLQTEETGRHTVYNRQPTHTGHNLFQLLPSERCYMSEL